MTVKRWLGNAPATTDNWTISLTGTVVSQTYSMTINGKSVTYTASGTETVSTILLALANAWSASTIPEFLELTATVLPASGGPYTSMTVTQNIPGRPSVITVATNGVATFTITNTTAATGPNDFTNPQNWSTGAAPANADTLVFDNGDIGCKYNLGSSLTGITVSVESGYSGLIGLPFINSDNPNTSYNEYRATALTLTGGAAIVNAPQCGRCNLAFGPNTASVRVLATGQRANSTTPVVLITGGNSSSELDINKGDVGLACYQGQTAIFPIIRTGYVSQPLSDVNLTIGLGATLTTLTKNGGNVTSRVGAVTINQDVSGGTLTLTDSAAVTTLNVFAGTVNLSTIGTVATINLYGSSTLSCDGDPRAKSVTNAINVYSTAVTVIDSAKTINGGVLTLAPSGLTSVNVQHGANTSIVYQ
ncbi:MAG: hypothetical protein WCH39_03985 [Schlesneria sp.]